MSKMTEVANSPNGKTIKIGCAAWPNTLNRLSIKIPPSFRRRRRGPLPTDYCFMSILEQIRRRAAADVQRIVLPESEDPRTLLAAGICAREKLAHVIVLGDEEKIRATARATGADLGGVEVIDHRRAADFEKVAALYHELRRAKGLMPDEARIAIADPLYYGNLLVRMNRADGSVAGATNT